MKINEATAFEREYYEGEKGMKVRTVLKPKTSDYVRGSGRGSNIRPAIPAGVTYTKMTPKMAAAQEKRAIWKSKRTWMGRQQGWVLLEDDSEDSPWNESIPCVKCGTECEDTGYLVPPKGQICEDCMTPADHDAWHKENARYNPDSYDSEDSVEIEHPTTCDCCETDQDALNLLFKEGEEE